jgi:hypothetical protein
MPLIGLAQNNKSSIEKSMVQNESQLGFAQTLQEQQVQITRPNTGMRSSCYQTQFKLVKIIH